MVNINNVSYEINEESVSKDKSRFKINIKLPMSNGWYNNVDFILFDGSKKMVFPLKHIYNDSEYAYFFVECDVNTKAIYHYCFSFNINGKTYYYKKDNSDIFDCSIGNMEKLSVNFNVPDWAKGKIMYHIFVDRFNKSSDDKLVEMARRDIHKSWDEDIVLGPNSDGIWNCDFFGGDLEGIIDKLDYIKSLGVSILYLSPIVTSQSNHRYDTADYENVDPYLGNNSDLERLCCEAHKRGMKVILDGVFNHTGNDSKYFNEYGNYDTIGAFQDSNSYYAKFYRKKNINGVVTYDYWWGMRNLPVCDGNSLEWIEYITGIGGVIDKWFSLGIDGLRLDVADELTDQFIGKIREAVKRNKKDGFILGEVWKNPMRMNRGYIESGRGMDSVMDYTLIDALLRYFKYGDCEKLNYTIKDILREYPTDTINSLMNFTSTHDITRVINLFSDRDDFKRDGEWAWDLKREDFDFLKNYKLSDEEYLKAKEMYKTYLFALCFLPGNLSIFYGDEAGVQGMGNLLNRKTFPWGSEDLDLVNYFKYIGTIRKNESFLEKAELKIKDINPDYFSFERVFGSVTSYTLVRRTNNGTILIPPEYSDSEKVYKYKDRAVTLKKKL